MIGILQKKYALKSMKLFLIILDTPNKYFNAKNFI